MLGASLVVMVALFASTARSFATLWAQDPLGHGYLVIPASAYLAWQRRRELAALFPAIGISALPVLALAAFGWLLGNLSETDTVQQLFLALMVVALVWGILGPAVARVLAFPLGFLLFALPLGARFVPALQDVTAWFAVRLLDWSGIPVVLREHVISIPGGAWRVAEACSGINYLTASLAIGAFYAGTTYRYWRHRIGFLVAAALVPLIANGLRVYGTIFIASQGGTRIAEGTRHYLFGWFVFAAMMVILFVTCGRWREAPDPPPPTGVSRGPSRPGALVGFALVALLTVAAAPAYAARYWHRSPAVVPAFSPPVASAPWVLSSRGPSAWRPHFESSTAQFDRTYEHDGVTITVHVAYYAPNQKGTKVVGGRQSLSADPWWVAGSQAQRATLAGQTFDVRETRLEGPSGSLTVWNWYSAAGHLTGDKYWAKLHVALSRLAGSEPPSYAIVIATPTREGIESTALLQSFLSGLSL